MKPVSFGGVEFIDMPDEVDMYLKSIEANKLITELSSKNGMKLEFLELNSDIFNNKLNIVYVNDEGKKDSISIRGVKSVTVSPNIKSGYVSSDLKSFVLLTEPIDVEYIRVYDDNTVYIKLIDSCVGDES